LPVRIAAVDRAAHPLGLAGVAVVNEDVAQRVPVTRDEIARQAGEGDEPAIRRDLEPEAPSVRLRAVRRDAHPLRRLRQTIAHKHVEDAVPVPRDEVVGSARSDQPPVVRGGWRDGPSPDRRVDARPLSASATARRRLPSRQR
jgi:hypothetical protein